MLKNIACRFTQETVAEILNESGLRGTYDFIYMPHSPPKASNLGYVFVNFTSVERMQRACELLHGRPFGPGRSQTQKCCEVAAAHFQGPLSSLARGRKGSKTSGEPLRFHEDGTVIHKQRAVGDVPCDALPVLGADDLGRLGIQSGCGPLLCRSRLQSTALEGSFLSRAVFPMPRFTEVPVTLVSETSRSACTEDKQG